MSFNQSDNKIILSPCFNLFRWKEWTKKKLFPNKNFFLYTLCFILLYCDSIWITTLYMVHFLPTNSGRGGNRVWRDNKFRPKIFSTTTRWKKLLQMVSQSVFVFFLVTSYDIFRWFLWILTDESSNRNEWMERIMKKISIWCIVC